MQKVYFNTATINDVDSVAEFINKTKMAKKIICLQGELGAGKTYLASLILKLNGVITIVNSPTFSIYKEYKNNNLETFFHFDLFRLNQNEILEIGIEEIIEDAKFIIVEWWEKASYFFTQRNDVMYIVITVEQEDLLPVKRQYAIST